MTEDAQRAEKKELLREWKENEQELARRRATAERIADVLYHVASELRSQPEKLIFSEEATPLQYHPAPIITETVGLDLGAIREVRDAIRGLLNRQQALKPRMVAFNLL
jgi:hypothetical protein